MQFSPLILCNFTPVLTAPNGPCENQVRAPSWHRWGNRNDCISSHSCESVLVMPVLRDLSVVQLD